MKARPLYDVAMTSVSAVLNRLRPANPFDSVFGAVYDAGVNNERIARLFGLVAFGGNVQPMFESMAAIASVPEGGTILDVPCGGGVAFLRELGPDQDVRYLAADLSRPMLERAEAAAERRGLGQVEIIEADVELLPVNDGSVDLCLCYNGLHCFPDPATAMAEIARCLKPGGRLVGSMVVRGSGLRQDLAIKLFQQAGPFGPTGTEKDLRAWAKAAGLKGLRVKRFGALRLFQARK